jgi:type III restriction enzyme
METIESHFSLADITDRRPYRELGVQISADPDAELRRTKLSAQIVDGGDGLKRTVVLTAPAVDRVASTVPLMPLEAARAELARRVLGAPVVPARAEEAKALAPLLDAFVDGLGSKAAELLSAYTDRAAARLIALITEEHRKLVAKPTFKEVTELVTFGPVRVGRPVTSTDRAGSFSRSTGYTGWKRSMYDQVWFDSSTEREVANIVDDADTVPYWVRLHKDDLPILWHGAGNFYNPDFIVVEGDGTHWIVEAKMDKEMESVDVRGKRDAALRWANHVSADGTVGTRWRYLLVSETDIAEAKGSWEALKKLGGA